MKILIYSSYVPALTDGVSRSAKRLVLGLKEKEDSLGEAQSRDIGTFIHELLNETFAEFIGKKPYLNNKFEKVFFAALDKKFKDEFQKRMKSDAFLIKEILDFRLKRFLENERQRNVQRILCLEKTFKTSIKFKEGKFRFKAVIDRIDRLDDKSILVLDYKTGGIDILPQVDIERIESAGLARENLKDTIRSFQLPLYLYFVINDKNHQGGEVNACLYSLREIDARTLGLSMLFKNDAKPADKEKIMRVYLGALGAIMEDILNPGIPFKADEEDARQCSSCPFFYMCR